MSIVHVTLITRDSRGYVVLFFGLWKRISKTSLVILAVTVIAGGTVGVSVSSATLGHADPAIRLSDNPSSPDWTVLTGTWTRVTGSIDGTGLSAQLESSVSFSADLTIQVKFRTVVESYQNQFVARINGKYNDFFDKIFLTLFNKTTTNGLIELVMWNGPSTVHIYMFPNSGLDAKDWHLATLVFMGDNVKAYIDRTLYFNVTDPIAGILGASHIDLDSWGPSESQFRDITVS